MKYRNFTILEYNTGVYQGLVNQNNQRDGLGIYLQDDGCFLFGEWKYDNFDGQGIIYYSKGEFIYGTFLNNQIQQSALIQLLDKNNLIIANFTQNEFNFYQEIKYNDDYIQNLNDLQNKYQNEIEQSQDFDSQFKYIEFQDQGFFIGICKNETPNGLGMITFPDQRQDYGFYKDGILHCFGKINFLNGRYYEGMIYNNMLSGAGVLCEQKTWKYGIFENDTCKMMILQGKDNSQEIINFLKQKLHQNSSNYIDSYILQIYDIEKFKIQLQNYKLKLQTKQNAKNFKQKIEQPQQEKIFQKYIQQRQIVKDIIKNKLIQQ